MNDIDLKLLLNEVSMMKNIKGPHIVDQIEFGTEIYKKDSGKTKIVNFIVLELLSGGELFSYIANTGRFQEPIARYFFK